MTVEFVDYGNQGLYSKNMWLTHARKTLPSHNMPNMMCIKMSDVKISTNMGDYDLDLIGQLVQDRTNQFTFEPNDTMTNVLYDPKTTVASGHIKMNGKL